MCTVFFVLQDAYLRSIKKEDEIFIVNDRGTSENDVQEYFISLQRTKRCRHIVIQREVLNCYAEFKSMVEIAQRKYPLSVLEITITDIAPRTPPYVVEKDGRDEQHESEQEYGRDEEYGREEEYGRDEEYGREEGYGRDEEYERGDKDERGEQDVREEENDRDDNKQDYSASE